MLRGSLHPNLNELWTLMEERAMVKIAKLCAAILLASAIWMSQETKLQAWTCNDFFTPDCAYCVGEYNGAALRECNAWSEQQMAQECSAYCVWIDYPGFAGGYIVSYYQDPESLESEGNCECYW
jgi:hypothetical protein